MYLHTPAVEAGSWWRVDTASGSDTGTTVYAYDGAGAIPNYYVLTGSTVRNTSWDGTARFWSATQTLYLKELTYQGVPNGTVVTSTGVTPAAPVGGAPVDIATISTTVAALPTTYAHLLTTDATSTSATGTLAAWHLTPVDATGGAATWTLPAASSVTAGVETAIKKADTGANTVTVSRAGSDLIFGTGSGSTTKVLTLAGEAITFVSNGVDRWTVQTSDTPSGVLASTYARSLLFTDSRVGGKGDGVTDNTAAFNAAMTLLASTGGELFFPAGVYVFTGTTSVVPGGVWLRGTGYDYHTPSTTDRPNKGAVLKATATMTRLIQLGSLPNSSASGDTGASMVDLVVDGNGFCTSVVVAGGRRNRIRECEIYSGGGSTAQTLNISGQNVHVSQCVISAEAVGDCILVQGFYDNKIWQNQIRQPATTGACVRVVDAGQTDIQLNHMWAGANGVPTVAQGLIVLEASGAGLGPTDTLIQGNTIEAVKGPEILLKIDSNNGAFIRGVNVVGNRIYMNGITDDNTYSVVNVSAPGAGQGSFTSVTICDNQIQGMSSSIQYKALVDLGSNLPSATNRWIIMGNVATFLTHWQVGGTPPNTFEYYGNQGVSGGSTIRTNFSNKTAFNGDGATTAFVIQHLVDGTPRSVRVTAGSVAAAGDFYVTADGTNITVTYLVAPVTGSNNVTLRWQAEL